MPRSIYILILVVLLSSAAVPVISAETARRRIEFSTAAPTSSVILKQDLHERACDLDQLGKLLRLSLRPTLFIKCGGPGFVDEKGIVWQSDVGLSKAATYGDSSGHGLTLIPKLYSSGRNSRKGQIEYHLPLPLGSYTVTFYFMELYQRQAGRSLFDIEIEGVTALKNVDIVRQAGGGKPLQLATDVELYDGILDITLRARRGSASLSAFSIAPAFP